MRLRRSIISNSVGVFYEGKFTKIFRYFINGVFMDTGTPKGRWR